MSVIKNKAKLLQLNSSVIEFIPKTFKACTFMNSHHYSHHYGSRQCTSHKQTLFHLFFFTSRRERIYKIILNYSANISYCCESLCCVWSSPIADQMLTTCVATWWPLGLTLALAPGRPTPQTWALLWHWVGLLPVWPHSYRGQTRPSIFYQLK